MKNKTLGMMISSLRKEKNMTQLELASLMNVTDKAVSKWERDLSCPDINSLPKLAEHLGVSVDDLIQCKSENREKIPSNVKNILDTTLCAIPIAMGVATVMLSILDELKTQDAIIMIGLGLACAGISLLNNK
ncbi:MAG: helix-turn-helix transcriptional regulator [Eubacteriales bacterium]